jgi:hypothetical protein
MEGRQLFDENLALLQKHGYSRLLSALLAPGVLSGPNAQMNSYVVILAF